MSQFHEPECNGRCFGDEEFNEWVSYIGKRVYIELDIDHWVIGVLNDVCVYGEAYYVDDNEEASRFCWPVLKMRLI